MMRHSRLARSTAVLLAILALPACTSDSVPSSTASVLSYQGDINLDSSQISGTLEEVDGCLAVNDGESKTLIAVNHDQKSRLLDMLSTNHISIGHNVDLPGSMHEAESVNLEGTDVCAPTDGVWLLGDVDTLSESDPN